MNAGGYLGRSGGERGQDAAEFALIFPILFLILMGIFDLGRVIYYASALHNAAREGARYAIIDPTDTAAITAEVERLAVGLALDPGAVTITVTPREASGLAYDLVEVSVVYDMQLVTPLIGAFFGGGNTIPLGSQASMQVEGG